MALRRMMRQAVAEIGPPDSTDAVLDHLRRAVPARRARKRQATVGAIAAGVFVAMAVPAVLHVTNSGASGDRPSIAGNSTATQGSDAGKSSGAAGKDSAGSPSQSKGKDEDGKKGKKGDQGKGASAGASAGTDTGSTAAASSPTCDANELGTPVTSVGTPDANGTVYGSFTVPNTSGSNCTVDSPGSVVTIAQGAADPTKVSVVDHTSGDQASGLPDPSTEPSQLVLEPGKSYVVRFAWVPSAPCTPSGGDGGGGSGGTGGGEASPSPSASGDTTPTTGDTTDASQLSTQLGSDGSDTGSVVVSHTAEPGAPSAAATIPDACAGTVYTTGLLPAS
ncbi:hypothetical protein J3486_20935 [Streptomyces sp. VRA16 Mangrove soil]|nr:hypothetical protein [Streptomyces sp. VRA16 Mangrove soil]